MKSINKISKFIFPFYNVQNHSFLMRMPWFRLLIVINIIGLFVVPYILLADYMSGYSSCWASLKSLYSYSDLYQQEAQRCLESYRNAMPLAISYSVMMTVIAHYLSQLIFFKIIIDFIVVKNNK